MQCHNLPWWGTDEGCEFGVGSGDGVIDAGESTEGGGPSATPACRKLGTLPGVVTPPLL